MTKFFGFLIAVAMSTGMANAALLASWNFDSNSTSGVVASGVNASATAFVNNGGVNAVAGTNGSASGNEWNTNTINRGTSDTTFGNSFSITRTSSVVPKLMRIDQITFNGATLPIANAIANTVDVNVYGKLNSGSYVSLASASLSASSFLSIQTITVNQLLQVGDTYTVFFSYTGLAVSSAFAIIPTRAKLDNIRIEGSDNVVPEPASIACFAGLFAVGAFRRLRKRA